MSSYINKVLLMGNLTRDPDLRGLPGGQSVCELRMAVSRRYRDSNGQDAEEACFVDVAVGGQSATQCRQYLAKGRCVFVEGLLVFNQWEDRNTGEKRSRLRVVAEKISFVGGGRQNDAETGR